MLRSPSQLVEGGPPLCRWEPAAQPSLRVSGPAPAHLDPLCPRLPSRFSSRPGARMPASDWRAALPLPGSPPQALRSQLHSHDDDSNVMVKKVTDDLPEGPILGIAGYCLPSPHHPREEGGENGESERGPPPLTCRGTWPPRPIRRRSWGSSFVFQSWDLINSGRTSGPLSHTCSF